MGKCHDLQKKSQGEKVTAGLIKKGIHGMPVWMWEVIRVFNREIKIGSELFKMVSLTGAPRLDCVVGGVRIWERREPLLSNSVTPFFTQTQQLLLKIQAGFRKTDVTFD